MNLKTNNFKKIIKIIILAILVLLLVVFVVKITVFEHNYYKEKEGSEREISIDNNTEELIEVEPTEEEVTEYIVAEDRPRYLTIKKIGINNARILPMGVNANGELMTPNNIFDVGWYVDSGRPGFGGTLVIDGHNGGPHRYGVFKELPALSYGDIITIERGDGETFNYSVVENDAILLSESNTYMAKFALYSPEKDKESVTLISCTGTWDPDQSTFLSRQFTRAVLIED